MDDQRKTLRRIRIAQPDERGFREDVYALHDENGAFMMFLTPDEARVAMEAARPADQESLLWACRLDTVRIGGRYYTQLLIESATNRAPDMVPVRE